MTIKSILVPLVQRTLDTVALESAIAVARRFDAHIDARYIRVSSDEASQFVSGRLDTALYRQVLDRLQEQIAEDDKSARQSFEAFLRDKNLALADDPASASGPSASWQAVVGDPTRIVTLHGGAFDLTVLSHPALGTEGMPNSVLDAALFHTARPVLLAPAEAPSRIGGAILLAWNKGIQSGHALLAAMPFIETADRLTILTVTTGAKQGPEPEEIADNLAWHGVATEVRRVPPSHRSVGETLLEEARSAGADLLVMGAYSHSRMREKMLGGVTRTILSRADLPVLMAG